MTNKTKKLLFSVVTVSMVVLPLAAMAYTAPTEPSGNSIGSVGTMVGSVVDTVWIIFAAIAVILFVWAGILFLTAAGNPEKIAQARQAAMWGVVGVVVMILAFSIFTIASSFLQGGGQ